MHDSKQLLIMVKFIVYEGAIAMGMGKTLGKLESSVVINTSIYIFKYFFTK